MRGGIIALTLLAFLSAHAKGGGGGGRGGGPSPSSARVAAPSATVPSVAKPVVGSQPAPVQSGIIGNPKQIDPFANANYGMDQAIAFMAMAGQLFKACMQMEQNKKKKAEEEEKKKKKEEEKKKKEKKKSASKEDED